ncbi:MAG: transposase, partial [Pseudorhodobacter sp.]
MSDFFWLTDAQMARLVPFFPKSHGKPSVDDRRVLSEIVFINRNGLPWRDAPVAYGPHKRRCNRWKRWRDKGVFARMMAGLAAENGEKRTVMIDATYLKAHRTATSMTVAVLAASLQNDRSPKGDTILRGPYGELVSV